MGQARTPADEDVHNEAAHDVLAAELFAVPAADPQLRRAHEAAHDVLAAEQFGVPAPDPELHHGPVRLPDDPAGGLEPHDVLAAEEFPMPAAPRSAAASALARAGSGARPQWRLGVVGVLAAIVLGTLAQRLLRRR